MASSGLNLDGPIRVILFDLGGTLIYEHGLWEPIFPLADEALWRVLHAAGVTLGPHELYGDSHHNLFEMYYLLHRGDLSEPTTAGILDALLQDRDIQLPKETLQAAMQAMYGVTQSNWSPETDALATLQLLRERGFRIGLVSNAADDDNTQALIDKGMFRPYLEHIISSAAFGMRKPHPDIFRSALEYFDASPNEAVMVGDNFEADILGAHGVGMQSIWITRRLQRMDPPDFEIRPNAVISALSEIPGLLGEG